MKFIIVRRQEEAEVPVLFSAPITHADMAVMVRADGFATLSAGFCRFEADGSVTTHGHSESLRMAPRAQDGGIIATHYRLILRQIGVRVPEPAPAPYVPPVFCPGCPVSQA